VVLTVAVRAVQLLQTKAPQIHIDEATCLFDLINTLGRTWSLQPNQDKRYLRVLREVAMVFDKP
jgi:hypothetical protein